MDPGGISLPPNGEDSVTITVKSPMGGPDLLFQLWKDAKVAELKTNVSEKIGVITEKFALMHKAIELKEDEWPIAQYGITGDATVMLHVKLGSGLKKSPATTDVVLFMPLDLPKDNIGQIRSTIRMMNNRKRGKPVEPVGEKSDEATRQKQKEHEKTRDRMRVLLSRCKHTKSTSKSAFIDSNIISSATTPPEPALSSQSTSAVSILSRTSSEIISSTNSSSNTSTGSIFGDEKPITEKELRLYFPCAETEAELEIVRHDLYLAPQNMQQVNEVRAKFDLMARVRCKICSKKLQLREQEQKCACERAFCVKHRQPESHHCPVDFKNQGRVKIHKENPKICGGGAHKGKVE